MPFIVPTYSVSPGTSQEASSKASITDVLTVLLDNTSKEITPRDVRDAVFSAWESSVIRYTTDGTTPYIGIDRNDVKDVKLFLGKKDIRSVTEYVEDLLSNYISNYSIQTEYEGVYDYNHREPKYEGDIQFAIEKYFDTIFDDFEGTQECVKSRLQLSDIIQKLFKDIIC